MSRLDLDGPSTRGSAAVQDALLPLALHTQVKLHSSDEREPLPLALHHTPLSVTLGVLSGVPVNGVSTPPLCAWHILMSGPRQ